MLFISCNKNAMRILTMPAATQNGSNTMGAYVNNTLWVPALSFNGTGIDVGASSPILSITGMAQDPGGQSKTSLTIYIRNFNGVGTYVINGNAYIITGNTAELGSTKSVYEYMTDSLYQGSVIVTPFDNNKHIMSGTFHIKLINDHNPTDSVYISSGRFDITFPLTQLN
jgi:hypothetical protein